MGWFKIHTDDLKPIEQSGSDIGIKTRDIKRYVAEYGHPLGSFSYVTLDDPRFKKYFRESFTIATTAKDAFDKAVAALTNHPKFDPLGRYEISVRKEIVKEPV